VQSILCDVCKQARQWPHGPANQDLPAIRLNLRRVFWQRYPVNTRGVLGATLNAHVFQIQYQIRAAHFE